MVTKDLQPRQAGILMPVFSIPSPYGIGDFSSNTYRLIKDCSQAGLSIWQILPLGPIETGEGPYRTYSSFAIDPIYISIEELQKDGLLETITTLDSNPDEVEYAKVRAFKEPYFRQAFEAFRRSENEKLKKDWKSFLKQAYWLDRYALFMALKKKNGMKPWMEWPMEERQKTTPDESLEQEVEYQKFLQWQAFWQWRKIIDFAHAHGIHVIGDIPIYVSGDSADVWQYPEAFELDEQGKPLQYSGCAPDDLGDGQFWGNPIYNWDALKKMNYDYWIKRLGWSACLTDTVRLDHFIGFDRYWAIPADNPVPKAGHFEEGPGEALFDAVFKADPSLSFIVEDLGVLRLQVTLLKDKYGMLGMRVSQYAFGPAEEKAGYRLPEACIVYPGTHDNDPIEGWYASLPKHERKQINKIFRHLKLKGRSISDRMVDYCLKTDCRIAILPMQDLLNFDETTRINRPGTPGDENWKWRLNDFALFESRLDSIRRKLKNTNRLVSRVH
ncbi:4-alpha-glucanotransferase [Allobaculum sp. JKK-2023]|uniref:4-alpha-glucanotransferase n=1 Tax=Allobaculum sp. JKK-2023 TaxID=3108943 RepID=UPI002B05AC1B|nr:4-alpha-glucanotransferase [Allobaculum sp. JKK-2023]